MALNKYLVHSTIAGALGGLLFGFDTAVIAGTIHALVERFGLTPAQLGFTVSIALWGTALGALFAGAIGRRIGSRRVLRLLAILYMLSAVGCAVAWTWGGLLLARFIGGLAIGGSSVLGPVYIAELAPAPLRGRLVGVFQVNVVLGILLAYLSNFVIGLLGFGSIEWRCQFGVAALPALFFFLVLVGIPESPRWLVEKNRTQEALEVLDRLEIRGGAEVLEEIVLSLGRDQCGKAEFLFQKKYAFPIFLAVTIATFNQLAGINAVLYYLNEIFSAAGFSRASANVQAVTMGSVNLAATLLAMSLIDRVGRRALLLIGCGGMTFCLAAVGVIFAIARGQSFLIVCFVGYIACFALSSGAVLWVYISEIFPTRIRVKGQALGSTVVWISNGIISQLFPSLAAKSPALPFVCFASATALQWVLTLAFFPETKDLSLEELERKLHLG